MYNRKRREFLTLISGAAATWPLATHAQQPSKPAIGYLGLTSPGGEAVIVSAFRKGLSEAGFDEGRNVSIEFRFAASEVSRLPALAAELVNSKVAIIFTGTTAAALAAKAATSTVPI